MCGMVAQHSESLDLQSRGDEFTSKPDSKQLDHTQVPSPSNVVSYWPQDSDVP